MEPTRRWSLAPSRGAPSRRRSGGTATALGVWALSVSGGLLAPFILKSVPSGAAAPFLGWQTQSCLAATTTLLFAAGLFRGIRRPRTDERDRVVGAVRRQTLGACALMGWLNVPAAVLLLFITAGRLDPAQLLGLALVSGFVGAFVGAPFGAAYGLAAWFVAPALHLSRRRPTVEGPLRVAMAVGATMTGWGALASLALLSLTEVSASISIPIAIAAVGAGLASWARIVRRRVRALEALPDGWRRVPLGALPDPSGHLMPLHADVSDEADHALVRIIEPEGQGAFRRAQVRIPWALVD